MNPIENKKIHILGAAKSGLSAARFLKNLGAEVFVSEKESADKRKSEAEQLAAISVESEFGGHSERLLGADMIVISPGIPMNIPILKKIRERGIPVYSELEIASWMLRSPVIAVTGSNGKTTTTTLIGEIFRQSGRPTIVAGNVGTPLSELVLSSVPEGVAVLEVSSFQAEGFLNFHPKAALLLNLSPDHMDRYKTVQEYYMAKMRVFMNQRSDDLLIFNDDDEEVKKHIDTIRSRKLPFSQKHPLEVGAWLDGDKIVCRISGDPETVLSVRELGLRGSHNVYNVMAAVLAAKSMLVPTFTVSETLKSFTGVAHRLEFVRELRGVKFFNDSKATNVDSAFYGLRSFEEPVIWIAGGKHKGSPYSPLAETVKRHVKCMILIGQAASLIQEELGGLTKTVRAESLQDAVQKAFEESDTGDAVLLSPACSSYDMFRNYEERGQVFKDEVWQLE